MQNENLFNRFNVFYSALLIMVFVIFSSFGFPDVQVKHFTSFLGADILDLDTVDIQVANCDAKGKICIPLTLGQSLALKITDNGVPIDLNIMNGCDFDTMSAYTYSTLYGTGQAIFGPYVLTSWPVDGQIFQDTFKTIPELVDSMNVWDPLGDWTLDSDHLLITGGFPGSVYDTMKVWVTQISTPSYIGYNIGITPRGTELSFDRGFHTVILEDEINGMSDTFYVHVSCNETVNYTVEEDSTKSFCLDYSDLLTGPASVSLCNQNNANVSFSMINNDSCLQFTGNQVGATTTCIVVCDSTGFCDTTFVQVRVKGEGEFFSHYIEIASGQTGTLCLDTFSLTGNVVSVNMCNSDPDEYAEFSIDVSTHCITYAGITEGGTDTICVIACDQNGTCDTTSLAVKVRRFGPKWVHDTLYINGSGRACTEPYILPNPALNVSVFLEPIPQMVFYNLDQTDFCIDYTGLKPGTDTVGLRLRDNNMQYDSLFVVVTILQPESQIIFDTLKLGEIHQFCLDTIQLAGTNFVIDNICKDSGNKNVAFDINDVSLCIEMQALTPGTDTACITLCDSYGVCDTVILFVTALDNIIVDNPRPPTANSDSGLSQNSQAVQIPVLANDLIVPSFTKIFVLPAAGLIGPFNGFTTVDTITGIITFTPNDSTCNMTDVFRYVVCNTAGCDTAVVNVAMVCDTIYELPFKVFDGFSPNNDGNNETFVIQGVDNFPGSKVTIYNRWGVKVMEKTDYLNDWNGTWNNNPLPDGIYFYLFDDNTGNYLKGTLTIRR
jgi:gliding motility-associated-like protein